MKKIAFICFSTLVILALIAGESVCIGNTLETIDVKRKRAAHFKRALKVVSHNMKATEKFLDAAGDFLKEGKINNAIEMYEMIIELAPYDFRPYYFLAKLYKESNQYDNFYKILERATRNQTETDLIFYYLDNVRQVIKSEPAPPAVSGNIFIARFKDNKQAAISFVFDDGAKNVYTDILPVFEKFGFRATIPVNPGYVPDTPVNHYLGSWEEWRDASRRGFEIANHSMYHTHFTMVTEDNEDKEINESHALIAKKTGKPPLSFAFPFDYADPHFIKKVSERHIAIRDHDYLAKIYRHVFAPVYGGEHFSVETAKKIINLAVEKHIWIIAECHTIGSEVHTFKPITRKFLRSHLSYIRNNQDKVWVDTFINVYKYLAEKKETKIQIERKGKNRLVFRLVNSLDPNIFSFPLTIVIDISPFRAKSVWASQGRESRHIEAGIHEEKIYVNAIPGQGPVSVTWEE
jgi:peptidoglycan/xylan/chitin deacetylase (PgdA/CDA1 family)